MAEQPQTSESHRCPALSRMNNAGHLSVVLSLSSEGSECGQVSHGLGIHAKSCSYLIN